MRGWGVGSVEGMGDIECVEGVGGVGCVEGMGWEVSDDKGSGIL